MIGKVLAADALLIQIAVPSRCMIEQARVAAKTQAIETGEERSTDMTVETYKPVSENEVAFQ